MRSLACGDSTREGCCRLDPMGGTPRWDVAASEWAGSIPAPKSRASVAPTLSRSLTLSFALSFTAHIYAHAAVEVRSARVEIIIIIIAAAAAAAKVTSSIWIPIPIPICVVVIIIFVDPLDPMRSPTPQTCFSIRHDGAPQL